MAKANRKPRTPTVYCRACKASLHIDDADPGCDCSKYLGVETKEGVPCKMDGTPLTVAP